MVSCRDCRSAAAQTCNRHFLISVMLVPEHAYHACLFGLFIPHHPPLAGSSYALEERSSAEKQVLNCQCPVYVQNSELTVEIAWTTFCDALTVGSQRVVVQIQQMAESELAASHASANKHSSRRRALLLTRFSTGFAESGWCCSLP